MLVLPFLLVVPGFQLAPAEDPLPTAVAEVTRAELEHHVRVLAADELAGRKPGTPGIERAARYLAQALAQAGLEPAGDDGGFLQKTGLKRYEYSSVPRLLFFDKDGIGVEAKYGVDFTLKVRGTAHSTEKLPLTFFYDYNHSRMPLTGTSTEAIYFSAGKLDKQRILEKKGIHSLDDWGLELEVLLSEKGLEAGSPKEAMLPRVTTVDEPEACELVEIRGPMRVAFEQREFAHVQLLIDERLSPVVDGNVVGRIRGVGTSAHPELAQEVVVLSAHYDHLGLVAEGRDKERADRICNGADDDASGCAVLLELAQAFAAGPKPARTLVFFFATGEESGGTGTRRYLAAPSEPLAKTVADLNFEMLGRPDELVGGAGHLWLTGFEHSNLGAAWGEQGLPIVADPRPEKHFFSRSDNYAFALEGVVAQSLSSFNMHKEYHTPRDEPDTLDYAHLEAAGRVALQAARTLADGTLQPAWLEGMRPKKPEAAPQKGLKLRAEDPREEKDKPKKPK
ncbi:MAG: M20/M25/M40 family metallo-hydrolase [Planctomycetes bacterium]|nr:M20/M25/M40 family metallo-hydrolase [Planctomycetota bacterium]